MKKIFKLPLLLAAAFAVHPAFAQDSTKTARMSSPSTYGTTKTFGGASQFSKWSIGIDAGALTPQSFIGLNQFSKNKIDFGYGAFVKYQFLHSLGARIDYLGGQFKASNDASSQNGNAGFPAGSQYSDVSSKLTYAVSAKAEVDVATISFLRKKSGVRIFLTGGYGLAGFKPSLYGGNTIKAGFVPVGAGLKFKAGEGLAINLGYDVYFFDASNLLGAPYVNGDGRQSKASYGYVGLEYTFGTGKKPALIWNNPVADLYTELKNNDSLAREINGVKTRVGAVEGDVSNLKKDSDGDGVSDVFDKCANTPAGNKVDGSGCDLPKPEPAPVKVVEKVTEEDVRVVREAFRNLTFVTNKTTIKETSYPALDKLADIMNTKANLSLSLKGYTDNIGKKAANMKLSDGRANSVKAYLVAKGVAESRITAKGFGMAHPIASNKTQAGRAKNRRVEFNLF